MMTPSASNREDMPFESGPSPAPDSAAARFQSILDEIIKSYQQLLSVLQEEKRLIIEGDVEDLAGCLNEKEEVLGRLKALEERRQKEIALICPQNPALSLTALIQRVPAPYQARLRSCQVRLEALTASIQDVNQMNGILVERILQQITSLLGLLKQMAFNTVTYQPTGFIAESPSGGKTIGRG